MKPEPDDQSGADENGTVGPDSAAVTVFLDAATKRLDIQFNTHVALDNKLGNVLSVGSAILPITFGLLGLSNTDVPIAAAIFLIGAGIAYGVLLGLSWVVVRRTANLAAGAQIGVLRAHLESGEYTGEGLRQWVANEYEGSIRENEEILFRKARYVGSASYALYLESALLSLAGVVSLLFG